MAKKRMTSARVCKFIQLYVRLKETDVNGYGLCCSCGNMNPWSNLHGGHFQPKGCNYNAAAFDERNVHIQCATCNIYGCGNPAGYSKYMEKKYGWDVIAEIEALSYRRLEREEILEVGRKYKALCQEEAKKKNFKIRIPS